MQVPHLFDACFSLLFAGTVNQPPTVAMEPDSNICMLCVHWFFSYCYILTVCRCSSCRVEVQAGGSSGPECVSISCLLQCTTKLRCHLCLWILGQQLQVLWIRFWYFQKVLSPGSFFFSTLHTPFLFISWKKNASTLDMLTSHIVSIIHTILYCHSCRNTTSQT